MLLMYQGLEVGQLIKLDLNFGGKVIGEMIVDFSVVILFCENICIELCNLKLFFSDVNFSVLLIGKIFELVFGDGELCKEFVVVLGEKALLYEFDVLMLILIVLESYGIDVGQLFIFYGVQVGQVIDCKFISKGVIFIVVIEFQHCELVKGDSKFVVNSCVDVKVGLDGVEFFGVSVLEWINGGICILLGDKGEMKVSYLLYVNLEKVLENSFSDLFIIIVSLSVEMLLDVQVGLVVLYCKFEVGEVIIVCL